MLLASRRAMRIHRRVTRIATVIALVLAGCTPSHAPAGDSPADAAIADASSTDAGSAIGPSRVTLVDESFDEMAIAGAPNAPWTTMGSATVESVAFASDHSVELARPDATGTTSLSIAVAPQTGRVAFQASVLARETAGFKAIPYIYDSAGNAVASIAFQDGNIEAHIGATATTIQPFSANVWYRIRVLVDTTQGVFDLYVDGVRKEHDVALRSASANVASMSFYMDGANTGTLVVDNALVYNEADYIGAPPQPVFDVRMFGAVGDGSADDTLAIQAAVNAAAGTGGSVLLSGGNFLAGTITLASDMTVFVDPSAVLLGTTNVAGYPTQTPATGNTQLSNCQRALLYAPNVQHLVIGGGGVIDGQGDSFTGVENTRPLLVWLALSSDVTIRDLYVRKGAVWSLVSMESDHVVFDNINLQSNDITHDGIDIVDGTDITVQNSAINAGDDAMCMKSGVRRGIDTMVVKQSVFTGNNGGSNGIKVGTATYGAFTNITVQDNVVKDVQYAAMAVESRQGADVEGMTFQRVQFSNTGAAFFVYLAQQDDTHPIGDVPKLGSIDHVAFTDIAGATATWANTPHQGSLVTGQIYNSIAYPITSLSFTRVTVQFDASLATVPVAPPEAMPDQYPEVNMFGDLPAWAYYLRHVQGVTFDSCTTTAAGSDARQELVTDDVGALAGAP
jgi:Glycosyl hydrolases family 28